MLLLSEKITNVPIMSLQTGSELAHTTKLIVDPNNLSIIAFYVEGPGIGPDPHVLFVDDIRESGELGFIVDDSNNIMSLDGLVRLQAIIDSNFHLLGIPIYTQNNTKIGKVADFSFNPADFVVYQLYVKTSILHSLMNDTRIIHRSQIVNVTPERIVVSSPSVREDASHAEESTSFVNPFRTTGVESQ